MQEERNGIQEVVLGIARYLNNGGLDSLGRDIEKNGIKRTIDDIRNGPEPENVLVLDLKDSKLDIAKARELANTIEYAGWYFQRIFVENIPESFYGIPCHGKTLGEYLRCYLKKE